MEQDEAAQIQRMDLLKIAGSGDSGLGQQDVIRLADETEAGAGNLPANRNQKAQERVQVLLDVRTSDV